MSIDIHRSQETHVPVASGHKKVRVISKWLFVVLTILTVPGGINSAQAVVEIGAPQTHDSEHGTSEMVVKFAAGLLSVDATNADVRELLRLVGERAGLEMNFDPLLDTVVTVKFKDETPEAGLNKVLAAMGERGLSFEYVNKQGKMKDSFRVERIFLSENTSINEPSREEVQAAIRKRDQEYRELFEKLDKDQHKIAQALKKYADPQTTAEEKKKLRTYFRQTGVHDPIEKDLLMGVSLDPQYREIASELDMALLHAMQDNPEESDKEYILSRWRAKVPLGWLLYAMLKVWDDRYIPYLIEAAFTPNDCYCIEIIGRAKVKEAVPYLEAALKDKDAEVRKAAYYALLQITGKKYEYLPVLPK